MLAPACGGGASAADAGSFFFDVGSHDAASNGDVSSTDTGLPPENQERRSFQTPQAGQRFVFVADPSSNSVAVIDSMTLAIQTVAAGDHPTYLSAVPNTDNAVVINVNSNDATVLRASASGTPTDSVPLAPDLNALAIAPDGQHAVAYFDASQPNAHLTTGSFQDISVLTLADSGDSAIRLSVGFSPSGVQFSHDGSEAFVITEDGISVLNFAMLTGPTIVPSVAFGQADEVARNVSVGSDGHYAIARIDGTGQLRLLDLQALAMTNLDVGSQVTDVELAPDGSFAIAVLRDVSTVLRIAIPGGFGDPTQIQTTTLQNETVGSVTIAGDGLHALLYTTATAIDHLTIMDLTGADPPQTILLRKAIRAVAASPDGRSALIVHTKAPGDPNAPMIDMQTQLDRSYGYSLLDIGTHFAKLQLTAADVGPFAIVPDGSYSFVVIRDDVQMIREVDRVSMRSFEVDPNTLGSPPLSVGIVPSSQRAFIGEDHPDGRITFIDWNTGVLQTVTGFELNSRVVM